MVRIHLATSDPRTRQKLFERAGLSPDSRFVPLPRFLFHQQFISTTKECLRELTRLASNDPLFVLEFEGDHQDWP
jgi:hypothetical protein